MTKLASSVVSIYFLITAKYRQDETFLISCLYREDYQIIANFCFHCLRHLDHLTLVLLRYEQCSNTFKFNACIGYQGCYSNFLKNQNTLKYQIKYAQHLFLCQRKRKSQKLWSNFVLPSRWRWLTISFALRSLAPVNAFYCQPAN